MLFSVPEFTIFIVSLSVNEPPLTLHKIVLVMGALLYNLTGKMQNTTQINT